MKDSMPYCSKMIFGKGRILWIKYSIPLLSTYWIDSDSLTNPSVFHLYFNQRIAHLFSSSYIPDKRHKSSNHLHSKGKKGKEHSIPNSTPFLSSLSITISSTKKTKDRATLFSSFSHFPLVLSPPRGKNYSVDESQSAGLG